MERKETTDPAQKFVIDLISRNKKMNEVTKHGDSEIQKFFSGATVFITGGTGFLGKQLIEKLLRATKLSKIFILLRPKKGNDVEQRLQKLLQDPVFDTLREEQPDFGAIIEPVVGDVAELKLGLSDEDWTALADQVHIIFHLAATIRFDEPLRVATKINVRGTREALALGRACQNLVSYVHVSTAYSHACESRIKAEVMEDFYKSPIDPDILIELAESLEETRLNDLTPGVIKDWPNTYTFSKAVAEEMVRKNSDLPICIVRPGVVICAKREPHPGWLDMSCVYGASGIILGTGLGVVHVVLTDDSVDLGLTPVDYVSNAIIATAFETARRTAAGETGTKIYVVITSARNPGIWGKIRQTLETDIIREFGTPKAVWCYFALRTNNPVLFWIYCWLLHLIPAYAADTVCCVMGKERRFVKTFSKIHRTLLALSFFSLNDWKFLDDNTANLFESLSSEDKEIFEFDMKKIDWREYLASWCIGIRKYILKDGLEGTEYAKKKVKVFFILSFFILPLYLFSLYKVFCLFMNVICAVL